MNFNEIIDLERGPRSALIEWLQRQHLLPDPLRCAQCNQAMELKQRNDDHVMAFFGKASLYFIFKKSSGVIRCCCSCQNEKCSIPRVRK